MAQLMSEVLFTGTLGNVSVYKMKGSDKYIVRTKGGASKEQIRKGKEFDKTRRINAEFGGRSVAAKCVTGAMFPLKALADHNLAGPLNSLITRVQKADTESEWGQRSIYFTRLPKLLEGFSLNKKNVFDSIVRSPVSCRLDKGSLSATIDIPALIPGINFFCPPGRYPLYSIIAVLGIVPDLKFSKHGYYPITDVQSADAATAWYPSSKGSQSISLEVSLQKPAFKIPHSPFTLMLSIGIRFGTVGMNDEVEQVKYAGAAKVSVTET